MRLLATSAGFALLVVATFGCDSSSSSSGSLAAPSGLATALLGGGAHLTWKDNSPDESEFQIERKEAGGNYVKVDSVTFDIVQYHDEPLSAGVTYSYRVRAVAGERVSEYSNESAIQTAGTPAPVSFKNDIVPMFNRTCGTMTSGCHARDAYSATLNMGCRGWLSLEDAPLGAQFYSGPMKGQSTNCPDRTLYLRLTQLDSWMCENPRKKYITAGSLTESQIYQAVAGDSSGNGKCQKQPGVNLGRMPPAPAAPLPQPDVMRLQQWIMAGAPNN